MTVRVTRDLDVARPHNRLATASMLCGALSAAALLFAYQWQTLWTLPVATVAIVLGVYGLAAARELRDGSVRAIAGIVLGAVPYATVVVLLVLGT